LYEAATLAMEEFRRCGFTENAPGVTTHLMVAIKQPSTTHEVQWDKVKAWLQSAGKPNEQAIKGGAEGVAARLIWLYARLDTAHGSRLSLEGLTPSHNLKMF
jgi:hypothetical protein